MFLGRSLRNHGTLLMGALVLAAAVGPNRAAAQGSGASTAFALENINNTTRISAVVVDGRLFDQEAVQGLLDNVVAAANL